MRRLAILGASGHGKVVADIAEHCGWNEVEFFDDGWPGIKQNGPWPVRGSSQDLENALPAFDGVFVAIGNNHVRAEKTRWLLGLSCPVVSLVHPSAVLSQYTVLGTGSVVMAGAIVNAFSKIGMGAILNTGCSVDHDCEIGDFVHVSPGARLAGGVKVGELSWIGIGACVKQGVAIGRCVTIGAGAAVIGDLRDDLTAVGVPAKPL